MRVNVVLPAPDGEDKISIRPRCVLKGLEIVVPRPRVRCVDESFGCIGSLNILNLLTELFYLGPQLKADRRERGII